MPRRIRIKGHVIDADVRESDISYEVLADGIVVATCADPALLAAGRTMEEAERVVADLLRQSSAMTKSATSTRR